MKSGYKHIQFSAKSVAGIKIEGNFLCISNINKAKDISALLKHNKEWAIHCKLCAENDRLLQANVAECSSWALPEASLEDTAIYADFGMFLLILDDFLDQSAIVQEKASLKSALKILLKILQFGNSAIEPNTTNHLFPELKPCCAALVDLHDRLLQKHSNMEYFWASVSQWFAFLVQEWEYRETL